jgi:hypothetical protein
MHLSKALKKWKFAIYGVFSVKTRKNLWKVHYFWNLHDILLLLIYDKAGAMKKKFSAPIRDLKPIVTPNIFFAYYRYFYIKMNKFQGYFYSK